MGVFKVCALRGTGNNEVKRAGEVLSCLGYLTVFQWFILM